MLPSLYALYLEERTEDHIIERPEGFATYRYLPNNQVYIIDIYVLSLYRKQGIASKLADEICALAKKDGCNQAVGTVLSNKSWTSLNIKMMFNYGFEIYASTNEAIILKKDI